MGNWDAHNFLNSCKRKIGVGKRGPIYGLKALTADTQAGFVSAWSNWDGKPRKCIETRQSSSFLPLPCYINAVSQRKWPAILVSNGQTRFIPRAGPPPSVVARYQRHPAMFHDFPHENSQSLNGEKTCSNRPLIQYHTMSHYFPIKRRYIASVLDPPFASLHRPFHQKNASNRSPSSLRNHAYLEDYPC